MSELVDNLQGVLVLDYECLPENPAKKFFLKMYSNECGTDRVIVFEEETGGGTEYTAGTGLGLTGNQFNITDPELLAILGLTSAADKIPYFTGVGTASLADFTTFGRSLVASANAAAGRTVLGLGAVAVLGSITTSGDVTSVYTAGDLAVTIANDAITTAKIINDAVTYAKMQNVSVTKRVLGRNTAGAGDVEEVSLTQFLDWVGSAADGDILYRAAGSRTRLAAGTNTHVLTLAAGLPTWAAPSGGGGGAYWTTVPGTPVRVGNTSFTITDTANANLYDLQFSKGMVLKWTDTGVVKQAMVFSASYSANNVTVNILGDILTATATMNTFKYGAEKARMHKFAIAGSIATTGTNMANTVLSEFAEKIFGADMWAGAAGNGTTTLDVNKNGTTMFASKPQLITTGQIASGFTADSGTVTAATDLITIDIDAVATTTKITDAYLNLYYTPLYNYLLT